jgi:hypothetical protein
VRPRIGPFKLHFVWVLYIVAIVYGFIVAVIVGGKLFFSCMAGIGLLYFILSLVSYWDSSEPLEGN